MTEVTGKSRVNRPYFFREVDGSRMEIPSYGIGSGDIDGNELRKFQMYVRARQIDVTVTVMVVGAFMVGFGLGGLLGLFVREAL